jgi:uncharacterized protein YigA (DUF484 family)
MSEQDPINADQVAAWLRDHPTFFDERPDLLETLRLPDARGDAVSLLERQASVLRSRNEELRERLNHLLDVARDNDRLFDKTRNLVLRLLEANNREDLFHNLVAALKQDFGSEVVSLLLYDHELDLGNDLAGQVRCVAFADLHEALRNLLRGDRAVCGSLREAELRELFNDEADSVKSAAMVPLEWQGRQGVLAIGSSDPRHFRSSMDTLFLTHIGEVLSRRLADFLQSSPAPEAKRA